MNKLGFLLWGLDLWNMILSVPVIHSGKPVGGNEDQHEGNQCTSQLARNARLDLQSHE